MRIMIRATEEGEVVIMEDVVVKEESEDKGDPGLEALAFPLHAIALRVGDKVVHVDPEELRRAAIALCPMMRQEDLEA